MSVEERYVGNVMRRIWASQDRRERLKNDLQAHFAQAAQSGETPASVALRLGDPADVADEFMEGEELHFAGFWERLFAFVADVGVISSLWLPLMLACAIFVPWVEAAEQTWSEVPLLIALVMLVVLLVGLGILYFPLFEKRFGKTPGKHIMRLRVRDKSGAEIRWGQAFLRRLSLYFEFLPLDALFVPFTKRKQRAFDIVADTLVLREPSGGAGIVRYAVCLAVWLPTILAFTMAAVLFGVSG